MSEERNVTAALAAIVAGTIMVGFTAVCFLIMIRVCLFLYRGLGI